MLSASSAAAASLGLPQPGTLPGDPFGLLVDAARTWLTGKKRTFRFPEGDLTMVLDRHLGAGVRPRPVHRPVRPGPHPGPGRRMGRLPVRADGDTRSRTCTCGRARGRCWWPRRCSARGSCRPRPRPAGWPPCRPCSSWCCATASRRSAWSARRGRGSRWRRARRAGPCTSARAPCAWATCACPCGRRPSACQCPSCPAGPCSPRCEPVAGGFVMRGMLSEWQRSLSREGVERLLAGMRAGNDRLDL